MAHHQCAAPTRNSPVHAEQRALIDAPQNVVGRRAMPKTAQRHRHHQVRVGAALSLPVAAQWDVEVVPEPTRQTNMPAPPELAWVTRQIWHVEVYDQLD